MRVMTWNLWWKFGPWQDRQIPIEAELARVDADLVLLQEVFCDENEDQAVRLAEVTGLNLARSTAPDGSPHKFGNAILSRFSILNQWTLPIPNVDGTPAHRSALFVEIERDLGQQLVVCTHLEWRYDQSETRGKQLQLICDAIKAWIDDKEAAGIDTVPAMFGGDMNASPDSDEIRKLTGLSTPFADGLIFTDAWTSTNTTPGFTWTRENPHSFEAQYPNRRLDFLLVAWPRKRPQMNAISAELAGRRPHNGVVASDHYAVVAAFDDRAPAEEATR